MPTAWSEEAQWYDQLVGQEGSEYQQQVVFPGLLRLIGPQPAGPVLDLACGQGALCRLLARRGFRVTGVDASRELVELARQRSSHLGPEQASLMEYLVGDACNLSFLPADHFAAATCVLAIQNLDSPSRVFRGTARVLVPGGIFVLVMMHPCFRGPRHTGWEWDQSRYLQYRRVERYLLPRKHPIYMHPGRRTGRYTWTFHRPLGFYVTALRKAGFLIDALEEWPGHKRSTSGPRAAAENAARREIPMFLALRARKLQVPDPQPIADHNEKTGSSAQA